jgi:hypothetical protein
VEKKGERSATPRIGTGSYPISFHLTRKSKHAFPNAFDSQTKSLKAPILLTVLNERNAKCLDKVLRPEVGTQVNNLPSTKTNQHTHGSKSKPLHTLIGALVGITETLLTSTKVIHLGNDIRDHLLDAAEVSLDGLQFLLGLDAGPIAGVGADFDIEFDFADGVLLRV